MFIQRIPTTSQSSVSFIPWSHPFGLFQLLVATCLVSGCTPKDYIPGTNLITTIEADPDDELAVEYGDSKELNLLVTHFEEEPEDCGPSVDGELVDLVYIEMNTEHTSTVPFGWTCAGAVAYWSISGGGDGTEYYADCEALSEPIEIDLDEDASTMLELGCTKKEVEEVPD